MSMYEVVLYAAMWALIIGIPLTIIVKVYEWIRNL